MLPQSQIENPFRNPNLKTLAIAIPICDTNHQLLSHLASMGHIGVHTTTGTPVHLGQKSWMVLRYRADDPADICRWIEALHYVEQDIVNESPRYIYG